MSVDSDKSMMELYEANLAEAATAEERERAAWRELDYLIGPMLCLVHQHPYSLGQDAGDGQSHALHKVIACFEEAWPAPPHAPNPRKRKEISAGKRKRIMERDLYRCLHCGTHVNLTIDHIVAVANGGGNEDDNLQTLCGSCNSSKGAK